MIYSNKLIIILVIETGEQECLLEPFNIVFLSVYAINIIILLPCQRRDKYAYVIPFFAFHIIYELAAKFLNGYFRMILQILSLSKM